MKASLTMKMHMGCTGGRFREAARKGETSIGREKHAENVILRQMATAAGIQTGRAEIALNEFRTRWKTNWFSGLSDSSLIKSNQSSFQVNKYRDRVQKCNFTALEVKAAMLPPNERINAITWKCNQLGMTYGQFVNRYSEKEM